VTRFENSDEFRGAEFVDVNMAGAVLRDVNMMGVRMRGVLLVNADVDGVIAGLRVNGVEVAPLVEAELDRQYPERLTLRDSTVDGVRQAWSVVESFWAGTMQRAASLPEADLHRSVDGEWSFAQTLRHLVFVTDAWLGHAVLGRAGSFHPLALPPSFITDVDGYGVDPRVAPTFDEIVDVRAGRMAQVREYLSAVTQEELDRTREPNVTPGWPPQEPRTPASCLRVLFDEEWAHHRFAVRDLDAIAAA
jgi:hypothetical protein